MASHNIYEILTILVERVAWHNETEKGAVLESIAEMQRVALFGNMATLIECPHDNVTQTPGWRALGQAICHDCGRTIVT